MIGDSNKELTRELDLLDESGKAHRATLVIDPENVIQTIEINADGIGRKANSCRKNQEGPICKCGYSYWRYCFIKGTYASSYKRS